MAGQTQISWHARFPYGSVGRAQNRIITTHAVHDQTLLTLCGRQASDWFKASGSVDCARCLAAIEKIKCEALT